MNIWKIVHLNCGERHEVIIDHRNCTHNLSSCEIKAWKGLNGIRTQDLGDSGVLLYQLSYAMRVILKSHWSDAPLKILVIYMLLHIHTPYLRRQRKYTYKSNRSWKRRLEVHFQKRTPK